MKPSQSKLGYSIVQFKKTGLLTYQLYILSTQYRELKPSPQPVSQASSVPKYLQKANNVSQPWVSLSQVSLASPARVTPLFCQEYCPS